MNLVDQHIRHLAVRVRRVRLVQFNVLVIIRQPPLVRAQDRHGARNRIPRPKRRHLRRVRGRVEPDQHQITAHRQREPLRKIEVHRIPQPPCVRRNIEIVQRQRGAGDVQQFNELIPHVVFRAEVRRTIHNFADHRRPDLRIGIRAAECPLAHRSEIKSCTRLILAEGHAVLCRTKLYIGPKTPQDARFISGIQEQVLALGRT